MQLIEQDPGGQAPNIMLTIGNGAILTIGAAFRMRLQPMIRRIENKIQRDFEYGLKRY